MRQLTVAACVASLCLAVSPVAAPVYSAFYVFGDSLSDVGNVYAGLGLGVQKPSLTGGTVYAFGSATTSNPSTESTAVPTLTQQIGMFLATVGGITPSSALYSVWIGSNDVLNILNSGTTGPTALTEAQAAAQSAATDIGTLVTGGARNILVPLVPDLGVTPAAIAAGAGAAGTLLAQTYNVALEADIGGLGSVPGLDFTYLDAFSLIDEAVADPGAFGFTNVTAPCYVGPFTGGGSVCADPNLYLFWDMDHPTAAAHAGIAAAADAALVPEPGTMAYSLPVWRGSHSCTAAQQGGGAAGHNAAAPAIAVGGFTGAPPNALSRRPQPLGKEFSLAEREGLSR